MPAYKPSTQTFKPRQLPPAAKRYFKDHRCEECGGPIDDGSLLMVSAIHAMMMLSEHTPPRPTTSVVLACPQCGRLGSAHADLPLDESIDLVRQVFLDNARMATIEERGGEAWPTRV